MNKQKLFPWVIVLGALSIDQLTKFWAFNQHVVSINTGIAFGALDASPWAGWLVPVVFVGIAGWWLRQFIVVQPVAVGLFVGAALSNLLDRWRIGGVVDWLPVPIVGLHNNLADWMIVLSLLWILKYQVTTQQKQHGA